MRSEFIITKMLEMEKDIQCYGLAKPYAVHINLEDDNLKIEFFKTEKEGDHPSVEDWKKALGTFDEVTFICSSYGLVDIGPAPGENIWTLDEKGFRQIDAFLIRGMEVFDLVNRLENVEGVIVAGDYAIAIVHNKPDNPHYVSSRDLSKILSQIPGNEKLMALDHFKTGKDSILLGAGTQHNGYELYYFFEDGTLELTSVLRKE